MFSRWSEFIDGVTFEQRPKREEGSNPAESWGRAFQTGRTSAKALWWGQVQGDGGTVWRAEWP